MWDQRYAEDEYVYGTLPNDFLVNAAKELKPDSRILCLAEGEGRNAVFLAEQGHHVTAVDASSVGLEKARKLAQQRGVTIETVVTDLAEFCITPESWDAIIAIFCHLPPPLRKKVFASAVTALKPGGLFILEGYTPKQLELKTGGPPVAELMLSQAILEEELHGLTFFHLKELVRPIHEGKLHHGSGAVVQLMARRP